MSDPVIIRGIVQADIPFIINSWLKSFRSSRWAGSLPNNVYWDAYHKAIEVILERPDTTVSVACLSENPDQILGYIVYCPDAVHYLYVKLSLRRHGIGKRLLTSAIGDAKHFRYTFRTDALDNLPEGLYGTYSPKIVKAKPRDRTLERVQDQRT